MGVGAWHLAVREVKVGRDRGIPSNLLIVSRVSGHLLLPGLGDTRRDHRSLATSVAKRVILGLIVHRLHHSLDLLHHRVLRHQVLALGVVALATWLGFAHRKWVHVVSLVQFSNRGRVRVLVSISRGVHRVNHTTVRLLLLKDHRATVERVLLHRIRLHRVGFLRSLRLHHHYRLLLLLRL